MSRRLLHSVTSLALLAALLATSVALAKESARSSIAQVRLRGPEAVLDNASVSIGRESGVVRSLANENFPVDAADPETMARQYLRANAARLSLKNDLDDLFVRATRNGLSGTVVRFEQRVQGVPVLAPDVVVTIDQRNRVTFVMNGYEPGIQVAGTTASLTPEDAIGDVSAALGITATPAWQNVRLVIVPDGKASLLAYEVRIVPSTEPHGEWRAIVDATTREIHAIEDISLSVNGTGYVFDPDPLGTAHATYGDAGFVDGADATTAQLDAARSSRMLLDITDLGGGIHKLEGPYATIVDTESPFLGLFTQAGTTFNFNRFDNAFEAVNCYYHVDHIMRHVNNTLGVTVMPFQYAGGVRFDPSGLSGADNSHYTSGNGVIAFGEGGVDDAEDADVVIHELGHGLHDWLTSGSLSQVNGLSEGTGDYVCQSYSRSLGQWLPAEAPYQWTFSWDGHNPFWAGRVTNYSALYPGGLVGQVHADGQIWATCLMRIWNQIGRNQMDRALFEGLSMTNSSTNQNQAAQAVVQAAVSLGYSAAEISIMVNEMRATGYTVSAGIDYVSHAITDECSIVSNVNGVLEPGESAELRVTLVASSLPRTGVTGVLTSSTVGVTILDGNATWPNLSPGVNTPTDAPHFRIRLHPGIACLSTVNFQLTVNSNEGGPFVMNFSRQVGSTLTPSGLPLAITDNVPAGVTSTLNVPTAQILSDVNVRVQITHTWVGDLFIKLKSPAGTEVVLLDRPGFPASSFGCNNDNMDVTFDGSGVTNLETHCAGTTPWYTGVALPVGSLAAFNGQSTLGNWVLTVSDNAGSDLGTLTSWELITTPAIAGICNVCDQVVATQLSFFNAEDHAEGIALSWELLDRAEVTRVTLERALAEAGPWTEIPGDYATDGSRTIAVDRTARAGETYYYRLHVTKRGGEQATLGLASAQHGAGEIHTTRLLGAMPNPTVETTSLAFQLNRRQLVNLSVVDAQGRRVRTLLDGQLPAGRHARTWDGADDSGKRVPAGVYFGVMYTPDGRQSSRFTLLR